jgi:hypothetical protein
MQAIGYANQLASQQANQLLQIRGLLIAQQNAIATRMQARPTVKRSRRQRPNNCARAATGQPGAHLVRGIHESNQGSVLGLGRPRGGLGRRLRQQAGPAPMPEVNDENCKPENIAKIDKASAAGVFVAVPASWWRFQAQPEKRMVRC